MPAVLGYGAGLAVLLGVFDYTGGMLSGYRADPDVDEYTRKIEMRKARRRPIQETIEELGEGRGIAIYPREVFYHFDSNFCYRHLRARLC